LPSPARDDDDDDDDRADRRRALEAIVAVDPEN
jgi:hypothetical protein